MPDVSCGENLCSKGHEPEQNAGRKVEIHGFLPTALAEFLFSKV